MEEISKKIMVNKRIKSFLKTTFEKKAVGNILE
jgi:hypothetical protein